MQSKDITCIDVKGLNRKYNNGVVPINLSWIMLMPGLYTLSEDLDASFTRQISFATLLKFGLIMDVYNSPNNELDFILLPSLRKGFMIAKYNSFYKKYVLESNLIADFGTPLTSIGVEYMKDLRFN
jgi:hypothetical protein